MTESFVDGFDHMVYFIYSYFKESQILCYADSSIFRKVDMEYMQKFPTIEIGLRAKCQILNTVSTDQTQPVRQIKYWR